MKKDKSAFTITSKQLVGSIAVTCLLACGVALTPAWASAETSKPTVLRQLNEWRGRVIADDEKASSEQKKLVLKLSQISFKRDLRDALASQIAERDLESPLNDIGRIDDDRVEFEARRRIVDQMIFAIDTKWSGSDLRSFLESLMLDLAITDLSEPGQGGWWKFLIQASISLRETAEPGADPVKFLEAYMVDSGVLEPKSALDLMKSRNYVGH
ncbi:hypothetical protein BH10BDE1_BH10BDE1_11840 [soil metagenome]